MLFGPAYKGIPLGVVTAIAFSDLYGKEIRYCSDRKEEKDHGADKGNFLGSALKDGDRVVMIEDVTTSGKSMEETVPKVRGAANVEIVGLMAFHAYGALMKGKSVCQGYAYAFKLLCDQAQIPCWIVTGYYGDEPHAWNYVWLDGAYYLVVTVQSVME